MEKLNLLLILLLSFFVLHLYSAPNSQQRINTPQVEKKSNPLLSSENKLSANSKIYDKRNLSYTINGCKVLPIHNLSRISFSKIFALLPLNWSNNSGIIFNHIPGELVYAAPAIEHLDYQISSTTVPGQAESFKNDQMLFYLVQSPTYPNLRNSGLTIFPNQNLPIRVLPNHNTDKYSDNKAIPIKPKNSKTYANKELLWR